MKIEILKIADLIAFVESEKFNDSDEIPITRLRALSQAKNPRADADDIALLVATDESDNLLAYLGLLPDTLFVKNHPEKIWWVSCWWANEKVKTNAGIHLFYYASKELKGRIYLPELTPETKFLLEKIKTFELLPIDCGIRGYLKLNLSTILPAKKPKFAKWVGVLNIVDWCVNLLYKPVLWFWKMRLHKLKFDHSVENRIDHEAGQFIAKMNQNELFRRGETELNWLIDNPWITNEKSAKMQQYAFTHEVQGYKMPVVRITENGEIVAVYLLLMHNGKAILTYSYYKQEVVGKVVETIFKLLLDNNIHTFTTFDEAISTSIKTRQNPFLFTKNQVKHFAFPRERREIVLQGKIQHGDGDCAFV
ncbi:MAG: hypothetical protein ACOYOT_02175 [Bacteroidales bacterium]